jgi:IS1 family transposase
LILARGLFSADFLFFNSKNPDSDRNLPTLGMWIWLALDIETREIVGADVGKRDEAAAQKLWKSLPPVYRQCAVSYTDFWQSYQADRTAKKISTTLLLLL